MFRPLLDKKETPKKSRVENLAYKALKMFPKMAFVLIRLFSIRELKKDYEEWLKKSPSTKSKKKFKARIDGTKSGKKYAKKMPALKLLYDYVNHCKIKTHTIYLFVVSLGYKDYIVDFKLVKKDKDGWNKIAKVMINRFIRSIGKKKQTLKYLRISLDGAWGNGNMLLYLYKKGFKYVAVKSGGKDLVEYNGNSYTLKAFEKFLAKTFSFKEFTARYSLKGEYCSCIVKLISCNISIRIVLRRFKSNSKKEPYRYLMLLSTNTNINEVRDYQIAQIYEGRWGIEECIKCSKQVADITDYSYHSDKVTNIEMFLSLRFCLYMFLNWYRVENCRHSVTSLYKVAERFRLYFNSIGYNSIWKLFSG